VGFIWFLVLELNERSWFGWILASFFSPVFNWVSFICLSNFGYFDYSFIVLWKLMWACFMVFCFVIL